MKTTLHFKESPKSQVESFSDEDTRDFLQYLGLFQLYNRFVFESVTIKVNQAGSVGRWGPFKKGQLFTIVYTND